MVSPLDGYIRKLERRGSGRRRGCRATDWTGKWLHRPAAPSRCRTRFGLGTAGRPAGAANAFSAGDMGILGVELMASYAVGLARVCASGRQRTTALVDRAGHRFQMVGVHACAIPAQMVQFEAVRDLSGSQQVGHPMRALGAVIAEKAVAVGVQAARPCDTGAVSHRLGRQPTQRADVVHVAHAGVGELELDRLGGVGHAVVSS